MKTYIFIDVHHDNLMADLVIIKGRSPIDAIRKHLHGAKIRRATNQYDKKQCDFIVEECAVDENGKVNRMFRAPRLFYLKYDN